MELSTVRGSPYFGGIMSQYEEVEQLLAWVSRTLLVGTPATCLPSQLLLACHPCDLF
jgi:hypothetical protein